MNMEEKVRAVEEVFEQLDAAIASFQKVSGIHCAWGCGRCCFKPDIEATILEFVPFALHLYKRDQAHEWLDALKENHDDICRILNPTQHGAGLCSEYRHRGLICRLFGFSARTNKYGRPELVTCQVIKTEQAPLYAAAQQAVEAGDDVPVMHNFYMQLHAIDFELTREFFPINEAIKRAIEVILHYYAYRTDV